MLSLSLSLSLSLPVVSVCFHYFSVLLAGWVEQSKVEIWFTRWVLLVIVAFGS
jgi:hypothetical protein